MPTSLPAGLTNLPNRATSSSLAILEAVDKLASLSLVEPQKSGPEGIAPSLIRGFKATVPSSELPKQRRRLLRGGLVDQDLGYEKIGLKKLGDRARGLLTDRDDDAGSSEDGLGVGRRRGRKKKRARLSEGRSLEGRLHLEDLLKQADEIALDKENLHVRTVGPGELLFESLLRQSSVLAFIVRTEALTWCSPSSTPRYTKSQQRSMRSKRSEGD